MFSNWTDNIKIENNIICTKNKILPKIYETTEKCDTNTEHFSFKIKMESSLSNGIIYNKSLILNY